MSNHRAERIFIGLREPIRGIDHLKAVDARSLCQLSSDSQVDADRLSLRPLSYFHIADFDDSVPRHVEPRRWFKATAGLKTVRGLLEYYQGILEGKADPESRDADRLQHHVATLRSMDSLLTSADDRDIRFCLLLHEEPKSQ